MNMRVSKIVRTRRRCECWGCGDGFDKGSLLRSQIDAKKGPIGNSYWCRVCDETIKGENKDSYDRSILKATVRNLESWKDNLEKYGRTYDVNDKAIKASIVSRQEVAATIENDKLIQFIPKPEQEAVTTIENDESVKSFPILEQKAITMIENNEIIEYSTEHKQEAEISLHSNGSHIEEFLNFFRRFDSNALLEELKEIQLDYEDNHKFLDIVDDLEDFEEFAEQLLANIESYVFEPILREDEDKRSLYLIYLTGEKKKSLENRLIGVADNIERLQYSVNELINQNIIGKFSETYNKMRFNDVKYLNTIPYLFIDETTLNQFETNAVHLSEAE